MTGRMPSEIGMFANNVSHIPTIPDEIRNNGLGWLMQRAGYDVAYAGKVHLPRMTATDVGFEYLCKDEREELPVACAEFIKRKHDKPFFLVASLINPHDICYMAITDFAQTDEERNLATRSTVACATMRQALQRPVIIQHIYHRFTHFPPRPQILLGRKRLLISGYNHAFCCRFAQSL
jgi:choline-sulfatase